MSESVRIWLQHLDAMASPIEREFFAAFYLGARGTDSAPVPQHEITVDDKRYYVDFAFLNERVVVECDGHDFHERTKEQAEADRSRDRRLTAAGWTVLRFTGREIHRSAFRCVAEVLELLRARKCKRRIAKPPHEYDLEVDP